MVFASKHAHWNGTFGILWLVYEFWRLSAARQYLSPVQNLVPCIHCPDPHVKIGLGGSSWAVKATLLTGRPVLGVLGLQAIGMVLLENTAKRRKNTLDGTLCLKFRYKGQGCSSGFHNQSSMLSCNFLLMFGKGWGWPSSQSLGCAWKRRLHISCQPCKGTWNWPKRASRDSEGAAPCRDFFAMVTF